ncbi:MAG: alpha/beta hydrolase [Ferruginibacter sp.]
MEIKQINFSGSIIKYKITGNGKPVMLLHGFGEDSSIWDLQVEFLKPDFQLIVPDLPGSGASSLLEKEIVSIADYAEAIKAILEAEKITNVIMIGHSMGGYITLAFAEKYADMLGAFGLFHSGAYADDEAKKQTREKAILFIEQNGSAAFLKTSIPGLFLDTVKSKAAIDTLIHKGSEFSPRSLIQYYRAMISRPDRTTVLKTFPGPILFLMGEHDKAIPFEDSLRQSHLPAHAYIHILRSSAHMGMTEETGIANEKLSQFLHSV